MKMIPTKIRDQIREELWKRCDDLGWMSLTDIDRARYYAQWTTAKDIGGQLAGYMDPRKVRVYIKDSLVKPYVRARLELDETEVWQLLGLTKSDESVEEYIKPHGRRLADGRVIGWGRSRDWKSILMAVFERGQAKKDSTPYGVVLSESGKTESDQARSLVRDAARRLDIKKIAWLE